MRSGPHSACYCVSLDDSDPIPSCATGCYPRCGSLGPAHAWYCQDPHKICWSQLQSVNCGFQLVSREDFCSAFLSSVMAGTNILSNHPSLKVIEVSIVDARFTGSVLPPWIAEVELILKYSDESVLQRRTAREAKAILGPWFTVKISEYLSSNVRTPGHERREQVMAACLYQTGHILDDHVLRAALKNGLVVAESDWFEYADNREAGPPSYRYCWISNEDPYDRYKRLNKRIREDLVTRYELSKRVPANRAPIDPRTPTWSLKRERSESSNPQ